ncbi:hypothetical protein I2485_01935 [Nesterenkonia sp. E16_7]|uniref:hypothetical protein n=1 Tax=unclassified Nesterenkonia TaxID=2629769 RepID=UPI001A928B90|nr:MULTISPECIES: hypothetical protein [unclassified Nesterenkonia]MBO0596364.1 hypothetical protein [Nesterenkonia sp. E16_10]MBO0597408.1 hypothetical protein [Nesterenkonia sp. E16_7]
MSLADAIAQTGGTPSAFTKETPAGTSVEGRVVSADIQQRRNYEDPNKLETWDDGNPKQQVRIVVDTGQPHQDPEWKGTTERAIYVKWWGEQKQALIGAVRAAGDTDVREGGWFKAAHTHDRPSDNPRLNDEKLFSYDYRQPSADAGLALGGGQQVNTATGEVTGQQQPAQQAQQVAQQPAVQQQAQPAAQPQVDPAAVDKAKQMVGLGLDDMTIANATGIDATVVASLRNLP